nr:histidine kinase [Sphaerochaetaceae bacterium]
MAEVEKKKRIRHLSLFERIILFMVVFFAFILLQMYLSYYREQKLFEPEQRRMENVQKISQFLDYNEKIIQEYENVRWEFGDPKSFIYVLSTHMKEEIKLFDEISIDPNSNNEIAVLYHAISNNFESWKKMNEHLRELIVEKDNEELTSFFYDRYLPCTSYLQSYSQQLLVSSIKENRILNLEMIEKNRKLNILISLSVYVNIFLGFVLFLSIFRLLASLRVLANQSVEISHGNFDLEDVDSSRNDEIGHMASAFNGMKRSMKKQVDLLEENSRVEQEKLMLKNLLNQEKLQKLRSQINPHFLFNTLNVIKYSAHEEKASDTEALIGSLGRLYRYALGSNEDKVLLSREIGIVSELVSLYKARFLDRISLSWNASDDVEVTETMVPSFILQPLVENSFKHGLGKKVEPGHVDIDISRVGEYLKIEIRDDGLGIAKEKLEQIREELKGANEIEDHIGLYNVAVRLRLLGKESGLSIDSEEGKWTCVTLLMPFEEVAMDGEEDIN